MPAPQLGHAFDRGDERTGRPRFLAAEARERRLARHLVHQLLGRAGPEREPTAADLTGDLDQHPAPPEEHDRPEVGSRLQPDERLAVTGDHRLHRRPSPGSVVGARDGSQLAHDGGHPAGRDAERTASISVRCGDVGELHRDVRSREHRRDRRRRPRRAPR